MPYRLLNIGQLLFLLPNPELKQNVRIVEKLNKRFINAKLALFLIEHVLMKGSSELIPIYIYIYIYIYIHIYMYRCMHHARRMYCVTGAGVCINVLLLVGHGNRCMNITLY